MHPDHKGQFSIPATELLEVLDGQNRPFMIMPREQVLQQRLPHRIVLIILRNKEKKIYIHKRAKHKRLYPGRWNVSASGHVLAGEAVEDAALRELAEELGVAGVQLSKRSLVNPSLGTDGAQAHLFVSAPTECLLTLDPEEISAGMFVDEDELAALILDLPEHITPGLLWAQQTGLLF